MKAESMKHLQKMYAMCNEDMGYFKELIEAIIRIESEPKTKSKFKIWDYVSDDDLYPTMCRVFHDSGFKVASDGHILIVLKEEYDSELERKLLKKDGTIETKYTSYPKWRDVIPNPKLMKMVPVKLDFEKIRGFETEYKAKVKAQGIKHQDGYVRVTENCTFKLNYLMKAVKFMEHIGTDILMVAEDGRRAALATSGENKLIVMPIYGGKDNEWTYKLY